MKNLKMNKWADVATFFSNWIFLGIVSLSVEFISFVSIIIRVVIHTSMLEISRYTLSF